MSTPPGNNAERVVYIDLTAYDSDGEPPKISVSSAVKSDLSKDATPLPKSVHGKVPTAPRKQHRYDPYPSAGKSPARLRFVLLKRIDLVSDSDSGSSSEDAIEESSAEESTISYSPPTPPSTFRR